MGPGLMKVRLTMLAKLPFFVGSLRWYVPSLNYIHAQLRGGYVPSRRIANLQSSLDALWPVKPP